MSVNWRVRGSDEQNFRNLRSVPRVWIAVHDANYLSTTSREVNPTKKIFAMRDRNLYFWEGNCEPRTRHGNTVSGLRVVKRGEANSNCARRDLRDPIDTQKTAIRPKSSHFPVSRVRGLQNTQCCILSDSLKSKVLQWNVRFCKYNYSRVKYPISVQFNRYDDLKK